MVLTSRNLDWWCERGILVLTLAALVFAPLAFGAVYVWTFLVIQMLVVAVGGLWLIRLWGGHKPKVLWPPVVWALVAFVLYAVGRYFTADIEYVARQELIRILIYVFLFLAVVSNLYGQEEAEAVAFTLTAVAAFAASYALFQFLHHSNHVWNLLSPYVGRASGTYINPDHFAAFLELVLPLPLAFLMAGRVSVVTRLVLAYASLTILGGLAVTLSRGGWVAAAMGILMLFGFLVCHKNHRFRAMLVLLALLAAGVVFTIHFLTTDVGFMRRVMNPDKPGTQVLDPMSRMEMWTAGLQMWQDHPWWGVGPGHFDSRFREYRPEGLQDRPEHVHDDYIEILADWGVAGGILVLAGVGILIAGLVKTWPHVRREENDFGFGMSSRYAFFLGAVSGLFALAVHSLVDFNLHVPANALAGVVLAGLVASNLRFATKRHWVRARLPVQFAATVVLGAMMIYFVAQAGRLAGDELWTARAEARDAYSPEQAAALKKALACEPKDYLAVYHLGECYRTQSMDGGENYAELAQTALNYYIMGIRLNPFDPYSQMRAGMCLDWLGRHAEAEKYFVAAAALDPNGNFIVANVGWHYLQIGDYAAARQWFIRAGKLGQGRNEMANSSVYDICEPKLMDRASGRLPLQLYYDGKDN